MGLTEYQIFQFIKIQLFHIYSPFSSTFRMVVFGTILIVTFDTSTCSNLSTSQTSLFKSSLVDVLHSFNINKPIFLFKVTLRNPNSTHVVHPNIMADRLVCWIRCLAKIIIIWFFLTFYSRPRWMNILLFVFIVWTFFCKLMIFGVCVFEERSIYMNWSSL